MRRRIRKKNSFTTVHPERHLTNASNLVDANQGWTTVSECESDSDSICSSADDGNGTLNNEIHRKRKSKTKSVPPLKKKDRRFLKWFRIYGQLKIEDKNKAVCSSSNCEDFEMCECRRCHLFKLYELDDSNNEDVDTAAEDEPIQIITTNGLSPPYDGYDANNNEGLVTTRLSNQNHQCYGLKYVNDASDDLISKWDSIMDDTEPSSCEKLIIRLWDLAVSSCSMWWIRRRKPSFY